MGGTAATLVVVDPDGEEVVVARVPAGRCDLALVDALAQLQLGALRGGARLEVRDASVDLRRLLEVVGLAEALGLQPLRQAELREQLGVEEVVQPGDAPVR